MGCAAAKWGEREQVDRPQEEKDRERGGWRGERGEIGEKQPWLAS